MSSLVEVAVELTFEQVVQKQLVGELARLFSNDTQIVPLLIKAGIPYTRVRALGSAAPEAYWFEVCREIGNGLVEGGFERLFAAVNENYPGNARFRAYQQRDPTAQIPTPGARAVSVSVPSALLVPAMAEFISRLYELGIPVDLAVGPGEASNGEETNPSTTDLLGVLENATTEQLRTVSNRVEAVAQERGISDVHVRPEEHNFRDYYVDSVRVEGPDQSTFELEQLRASTTVAEVAKGVIEGAYSNEFLPSEKGSPRRATLDHVQPDGTSRRLNPTDTLHDAGVRPNAHLRLHPDARAGAVNPFRRYESLVAARNQILNYRQAHPEFEVESNDQETPTEYLFRFRAESYAPGNPPLPISAHEVFLIMPPDFPVHGPLAFWQHPILHPNIHADNGAVCLGALQESYVPGLDFALVCDMLRDIASYRNYVVHEGFNPAAAAWIAGAEGQAAIIKVGGRSLAQVYGDETRQRASRYFKLRRMDP